MLEYWKKVCRRAFMEAGSIMGWTKGQIASTALIVVFGFYIYGQNYGWEKFVEQWSVFSIFNLKAVGIAAILILALNFFRAPYLIDREKDAALSMANSFFESAEEKENLSRELAGLISDSVGLLKKVGSDGQQDSEEIARGLLNHIEEFANQNLSARDQLLILQGDEDSVVRRDWDVFYGWEDDSNTNLFKLASKIGPMKIIISNFQPYSSAMVEAARLEIGPHVYHLSVSRKQKLVEHDRNG